MKKINIEIASLPFNLLINTYTVEFNIKHYALLIVQIVFSINSKRSVDVERKKKSTMLLIFYLFCLMFTSQIASSQINSFNYNEHYFSSPQTSEFLKHGSTPVSMYTGKLNLEILLHKYQDLDFEFSVSMSYNSTGFVSNKQPGPIGMDWGLIVGGVISRKIVGVPDDHIGFPTYTNVNPLMNGFLCGIKNNPTVYTNSGVFNFTEGNENTNHVTWNLGSLDQAYETESDIYSFNFMGQSGKFIIGQDGVAKVIDVEGCNGYKINLTNVSIQPEYSYTPSSSSIIITDCKGYQYTFGGEVKYLEYIIRGNGTSDLIDDPMIVSWYLKEVLAPNGRKITIEYLDFDEGIYPNNSLVDQDHWLLNIYPKSYKSYFYAYNSFGSGIFEVYNKLMASYSSELPNVELLKTVYISKIVVDGSCEIKFNYSKMQKKFYQDLSYGNSYNKANLKLDGIIINNKISDIKTVTFNTLYKGGINKERLYLDNIDISSDGKYYFSYNEGSFPSPQTRGLDYWGFWNGVDDNQAQLIPQFTLDSEGNIDYVTDLREPNALVFDIGMLNKITYPTGGYSTFEYEPHEYNYRLDRRSDNLFIPKLYQIYGIAGGARIKNTIDFESDGTILNSSEYIYKSEYSINDPNSGICSGLLLNWPRYVYHFSSDFFPGEGETIITQINSLGFGVDAQDAEYITYSSVIVKRSDNSHAKYIYSNYTTNPDDLTQNTINSSFYGSTIIPYNFYCNIYRNANSRAAERGKLILKSDYTSSGQIVNSESNIYDRIGNEEFVAAINLSGDKFYSYKSYINPYLLKHQTISTYTSTIPVSITSKNIDIEYNNQGLITIRSFTDSRERIISSKFKYVIDYQATPDYSGCETEFTNCEFQADMDYLDCIHTNNPDCDQMYNDDIAKCEDIYNTCISMPPADPDANTLFQMQKRNMIGYIVESQNLVDDNLVNGILTKYRDFGNNLFKPVFIYKSNTQVPISSASMSYFDINGNFVIDDAYEEDLLFDTYDSKGNVLQSHRKDNTYSSYLYGYNNAYLIADTKNTTSTECSYTGFENNETLGWSLYNNQMTNDPLNVKTGKTAALYTSYPIWKTLPIWNQDNTHSGYKASAWVKGSSSAYIKIMVEGNSSIYRQTNNVGGDPSTWKLIEVELPYSSYSNLYNTDTKLQVQCGSSSIAYFDDIRFYPMDAQMTTYTYDPLIGLTSVSDINNKPIKYEYDAFGRLVLVRDFLGEILKKYDYNYAH